jgi:hypothetical protein
LVEILIFKKVFNGLDFLSQGVVKISLVPCFGETGDEYFEKISVSFTKKGKVRPQRR